MVIHELHTDDQCPGLEILRTGLSSIEEQDLAVNYHPFYENNPANLFYLLKTGRYLNGCYFVIEDQGQYIGSAGWNIY